MDEVLLRQFVENLHQDGVNVFGSGHRNGKDDESGLCAIHGHQRGWSDNADAQAVVVTYVVRFP